MSAANHAEVSWPLVRVGDTLALQNGYPFKPSDWRTEGRPIIRIQNLNAKAEAAPFNYFDGELHEKFRANTGDLLFAWSGTPGTSFGAHVWNGGEAWINQHIFRVDFDGNKFDRDFLSLALNQNLAEYIFGAQGGVGLAHITKEKLNQSRLPMPPIEVQRQIVSAARTHEKKGESASLYLRLADSSLIRFRRSLLASACSGRLTNEWRSSRPDSSSDSSEELVRTIEAERAETDKRWKRAPIPLDLPFSEIPGTWSWTTIGNLVKVATGATPLRSRTDYYGGHHPWVTSGAVNQRVITTAGEYITDAALKETNAKLFPAGSLVVAMYGEGQTRGRVAELAISAATNQALAALLFDGSVTLLKPYIRLFLEQNYERLRQVAFGGVQPNLSLGTIRNIAIPLPPLSEQEEIVRRVQSELTLAAKARALIDTSSQNIVQSQITLLRNLFADMSADTTAA